jgi:hypothetical protein
VTLDFSFWQEEISAVIFLFIFIIIAYIMGARCKVGLSGTVTN